MYTPRNNFSRRFGSYAENDSSKILNPVFARVRIQAPHVFAEKLIPQEFFPACIGFVPGGVLYHFSLEIFPDEVHPLN